MASIWSISLDDAVSLVRAVPVGTPRTDRSSTFDRGRGVSALYVFMDAGTPNVYFTRENCRTGNDDIMNSVFI